MKYKINIFEIRKKEDNDIKKEISQIKDSKLNDFNKTLLVLKKNKTTVFLIPYYNSMFIILNSSLFNSLHFQNFNNSLININKSNNCSDSTCFDSISNINNNSNNSIIAYNSELKFNLIRSNFYLKHNLYDVPIGQLIDNYNHPLKYKINETFYAFVYRNDLTTYCITIIGFLSNNNNFNLDSFNLEKYNYNCQFYSTLGLYFCGKNIKLKFENKVEIKKCAPNEFICKDCMEINKKKYNLKQNYLININGRVAKINKGSYHCFGKFLSGIEGNQIEDCIKSFSCRACKILNYYSKYFFN